MTLLKTSTGERQCRKPTRCSPARSRKTTSATGPIDLRELCRGLNFRRPVGGVTRLRRSVWHIMRPQCPPGRCYPSHARNCPGDGLHRHANDPSQHDHDCPEDMRLCTKYDHIDGYECHPCGEKRAYGGEKFRSIDLFIGRLGPAIWFMERQRGSINSQIEPDCAGNHHDDDKTLRSEHADPRPHMGGDEQSACCSGHREPDAFQEMGGFSDPESHRGAHRVREGQVRTFSFGAEGIARPRPWYRRHGVTASVNTRNCGNWTPRRPAPSRAPAKAPRCVMVCDTSRSSVLAFASPLAAARLNHRKARTGLRDTP